jgi:hypothetical protein
MNVRVPIRVAGTAMVLLACGASGSSAQSTYQIQDLYSTGVDAFGLPLGAHALDPHFTQVPGGTMFVGAGTYVSSLTGSPYGLLGQSRWISPDAADGAGGQQFYTVDFQTSFTLTPNVDVSTVVIAGTWSADDQIEDVLINGHSTGVAKSSGWYIYEPFALPTGFYHTGVNYLTFVWTNNGGPGALDVNFTSKYAQTYAPEPGSYALLVSAGLSVAALRRRRRKP